MYGAEPANAADAARAKRAGQAAWTGASAHPAPPRTCADGLKTVLLENNWPIVRDLVDAIFTVSEVEIIEATHLVYSRAKLAIEPSAGVGVAVACSDAFRQLGHRRVAVVLCGGNIQLDALFDGLKRTFAGM